MSDRFSIWKEFRDRWPLEKLKSMTIDEYTSLGGKDSFCYWLERRTEDLGSIWGGSAYKFGIFEFNPNRLANQQEFIAGKDDKYAWGKKYGKSSAEAFQTVKSRIVSISENAQTGNWSNIDSIDFGHATKWKLAFLYQPQEQPQLLPIYKEEWLREATECYDGKTPSSKLFARIIQDMPECMNVFDYANEIGKKIAQIPKACWIIAPGENAYMWEDFLEYKIMGIGWDNVGDLSAFENKNDLSQKISECYKDYSGTAQEGKSPEKIAGMLWKFRNNISLGDIVFVRHGLNQIIGYGIVKSAYRFDLEREDYKHVRDIEWIHGQWGCPDTLGRQTLVSVKPERRKVLEAIVKDDLCDEATQSSSAVGTKCGDKWNIPYDLNTIFYGPPGTGKTHTLLMDVAQKYFTEQKAVLTPAERNARIVAELSWWEVVALVLMDIGHGAKVSQILGHELMQVLIKNSSNQKPANAIWGQLQIHCKDDCMHVNYDIKRRAEPKVFSKDDNSVWTLDRGLIEEGRPDLLEALKEFHTMTSQGLVKRYQVVTFHQSFCYENFVEGIAAKTDEEGNITYNVESGIFWKFCNKARQDPEHPYALFIDEINRGNISGIFGELISLIEINKRAGAPEEVRVILPYSKAEFAVPKNLYVFGSMNTADRSIDALDSALRRRFSFAELAPNPLLLNSDEFSPNFLSIDLAELLRSLNRRVEYLLDQDHKIGHSYFMNLSGNSFEEELRKLQKVFKDQIIPLLEDYFHGKLERVWMILGDKFVKKDILNANCLMAGMDLPELQDKFIWKIADISKLSEDDFKGLIKN